MTTFLKFISIDRSNDGKTQAVLEVTAPPSDIKKYRHDLHNAVNGIADFVGMLNSGDDIDKNDMREIAITLKDKLIMIRSEIELVLGIYRKID